MSRLSSFVKKEYSAKYFGLVKTAAIVKHFDHVQNRNSSLLFKFRQGGGIAFATAGSSTRVVLSCILFVKSCLIPAVLALVT